MKKILENYKTTVAGFVIIGIATYGLFEGKMTNEIAGALFAGAIGLIASKDGDKK